MLITNSQPATNCITAESASIHDRSGVARTPDLSWMLALSAVMQLVAGWLFVINTWARIKER